MKRQGENLVLDATSSDPVPPLAPLPLTPTLKFLGMVDYETTWQAMKQFTAQRTPATRDEIWLLQHPPHLYTRTSW